MIGDFVDDFRSPLVPEDLILPKVYTIYVYLCFNIVSISNANRGIILVETRESKDQILGGFAYF